MNIVLVINGVKNIRNKTQYQHSELLTEEHNTIILSKSQVASDIEEKSKNTHCFRDWIGSGFLFPYWAILFSLYYHISSDCDILYTTHSSQCIFTGMISILLDITWVADIWDDPQLGRQINRYENNNRESILPNKLYSTMFSYISMRSLKYCDLIILSISGDIRSTWNVDIDDKNVLQITNGVDIDYTRSLINDGGENKGGKSDVVEIAYVGHVSRGRGAGMIVETAKILQKNIMDEFEIKLMGPIDESDHKWLKNEIRTHDLNNSLKITGDLNHKNVLNEISTADVCINILNDDIKNYNYAYPIKIFEYMVLGKAIISTKTTGVEEILEDKDSGILLNRNNPKKLAEYIQVLSNDSQLRQRLGKNAKDRSEDFDWFCIRKEINRKIYDVL